MEDFKPEWIRRRSRQRTDGPGSIPVIYCERCSKESHALTTTEDRAFITVHSKCRTVL